MLARWWIWRCCQDDEYGDFCKMMNMKMFSRWWIWRCCQDDEYEYAIKIINMKMLARWWIWICCQDDKYEDVVQMMTSYLTVASMGSTCCLSWQIILQPECVSWNKTSFLPTFQILELVLIPLAASVKERFAFSRACVEKVPAEGVCTVGRV